MITQDSVEACQKENAMKLILSGTDRQGSNTLQIAKIIRDLYAGLGEKTEILDLAELRFPEIMQKSYYGNSDLPESIKVVLNQINQCEGLIIVCPEYNGSMPGILKWFIDHFKYPDTFEFRPICFIGLGGMFGGLRPIEHLQQVFGYRNSFIYPERIFLINIFKTLKEGVLTDQVALDLMKKQAVGFQKFCKALQSEKLDANSVLKMKSKA